MSEKPDYKEYHPRWFRHRMSTYWWLWRPRYRAFMLREVSSIFVAWFVVYLLLLIGAVIRGDESYQQFLSWSASGGILALNGVTLFLVVFHAITWFKLAPQAVTMRLRGKRVPDVLIFGSNYAAWALVSALLAWIILGG